jgi:hypothetical protein
LAGSRQILTLSDIWKRGDPGRISEWLVTSIINNGNPRSRGSFIRNRTASLQVL